MAQRRHQRHEAGAVRDEQQRSAIVGAPGERAADGPRSSNSSATRSVPVRKDETSPSSIRSTVNATFALSGADAIAYERSAW
jgi:hypothetical protein